MRLNRLILFFLFSCVLTILSCAREEVKNDPPPSESPNPKIGMLIPNTGRISDLIKVVGENFGSVKENIIVYFENQEAETIELSNNQITVKVPSGSGKVEVSVSVKNEVSNKVKFTFNKPIDDKPSEDKNRIKMIIENNEPFNWVITGNSITQGAKHTHGMRAYPEIFAERIRWETQRNNDFIINTAISGNTTQNILNDFDKRINQFNPKIVIIMIGTNDAVKDRNISVGQFGINILELIRKIREIGAIPVLMSPNIIIIEKNPERSRLGEYAVKMKEVAQLNNVIYIDNWKIWNIDLQAKYKGEVFKVLLNDPLHPNGFGHQEIAKALFKELSIFDPSAATCGGEYYEGYH